MVDRLVCGEDGDGVAAIDRSAMGSDSKTPSGAQAGAQGRSPVGRRSQVSRRHPVDSVDWSALERAAAAVRQFDDLLAAPVRVVEDRGASRSVAGVPGAVERARTDPLERVFH